MRFVKVRRFTFAANPTAERLSRPTTTIVITGADADAMRAVLARFTRPWQPRHTEPDDRNRPIGGETP